MPQSKSNEPVKDDDDDEIVRLCQITHLLVLLIAQEIHLHHDAFVFTSLLTVKKIKSK